MAILFEVIPAGIAATQVATNGQKAQKNSSFVHAGTGTVYSTCSCALKGVNLRLIVALLVAAIPATKNTTDRGRIESILGQM